MTQENIGISIHQSVKITEKVGLEIDSLSELIQREIDKAISSELSSLCKVVGSWNDNLSERYDDHGWVCTDYAFSLGLGQIRKGKPTTDRWLGIQISLAGDGMCSEVVKNEQPLVHICLWSTPIDFDASEYMGPECDSTALELIDNILFDWSSDYESWHNKEWNYSLFLTSLNTINDIREKIVQPVTELMKGNSPQSAKLEKLEGVVKYNKVDSDQFNVVSYSN